MSILSGRVLVESGRIIFFAAHALTRAPTYRWSHRYAPSLRLDLNWERPQDFAPPLLHYNHSSSASALGSAGREIVKH